jgi:hypothetical protein
MDAVTVGREVDPHRADRVVRPGSDRERFARVNALEMVVGIVAVGRIATDFGYLQDAGGEGFSSVPTVAG